MKLLKAAVVLISFVISLFLGLTAIEQFEHFQEASHTYHTQFHLINIVALVTAAVALLAFAVVAWQVSDDLEESPISIDDYLRSVFFGTFGVVAVGLASYESAIHEGKALPRHMGNGYHGWSSALMFFIGAVLVLISIYYLMRGPNRQDDEREAAAQAPGTQDQPKEAVAPVAPPSPQDNHATSATQPCTPVESAAPGSRSLTAVINCEFDDDKVAAVYVGDPRDVKAAVDQLVDGLFPEEDAS